MRSFAETPSGSSPRDVDLDRLGTSMFSARAERPDAAISVAPMPKAKAPSAPWVVVWLSVPTTTCRADVAALGQDLVADAALVGADVVELRDSLLGDELADPLLVGRGLRAFGGNAMVEDDRDLRGIPDAGSRVPPVPSKIFLN
jgi:hypothetical protein